ncbi:hypothetical protein P152DRAFT_22293 [Eremomyces bilateralis CBS 781.70]|uniref:Uncharacterized protein n=1 Tax=Eremomyces bilateralis CBS 781.70 TaxID=1392243 RepID=A0A6G1GHP9_9PEZI|nr:uncharacterized protein P152DRAFT_22293 [Eremomyces bilateralis CBS 781.70]KAF1817534.1 hypothetical protein P152DRAFT_22293 [Eremomyces bilateralis CBS 781.70]
MCLMSKEKPSRSRKRPLSQEEYLLPNRVVTTKRRATDHNVYARRSTRRTAQNHTSTIPRKYAEASAYAPPPVLHGHGVRRAPPQPLEHRTTRTHRSQSHQPEPAPKVQNPTRERANTRKKRTPLPNGPSTQNATDSSHYAQTYYAQPRVHHHQHYHSANHTGHVLDNNFAGRAAANTVLESVRRDAFRSSHGRLRRVPAVDLANVRTPFTWDYAHSQHQAHYAPSYAPVATWA